MSLQTRLPAKLILREIDEYIAHEDEEVRLRCKTGLFERAGVNAENRRWVLVDGAGMDFRVADKLMTAMGKSFKWWTDPELNEHYMAQDLSDSPSGGTGYRESPNGKYLVKCKCQMCGNAFQYLSAYNNGRRRTYCGDECFRLGKNEWKRKQRAA